MFPMPPGLVVEVQGTAFERGRAHGQAARTLIAPFLDEHFAFLEYSARHVAGFELDREKILRVTDQFLPACQRFAPELVEEVRGIAAGSGQAFREVFSLNTFIDIADWVRPATAHNYALNGCTAFGACAPATDSGQVLLGQTFDTKAAFEPYVLALKIEGPAALPAWVATFAGVVGCAGINRAGVGVVINHLNMADARPGVPFTFAVRQMLCASSAEEALTILRRSERASGIHYLVGDEWGLSGVETSATLFERLEVGPGWWAHANHCDRPDGQRVETLRSESSLCRGERAREVLARRAGRIDSATLADLARDHLGEAGSICTHPDVEAPRLRQYQTCFAVVLEPQARAMTFWTGNPCAGRQRRLTV